jgi:hypothetical protein
MTEYSRTEYPEMGFQRVILTDQRCEDVIREYRSVILIVYRITNLKE